MIRRRVMLTGPISLTWMDSRASAAVDRILMVQAQAFAAKPSTRVATLLTRPTTLFVEGFFRESIAVSCLVMEVALTERVSDSQAQAALGLPSVDDLTLKRRIDAARSLGVCSVTAHAQAQKLRLRGDDAVHWATKPEADEDGAYAALRLLRNVLEEICKVETG